MKRFLQLIALPYTALIASCSRPAERPASASPREDAISFYSFKMKDLEGKEVDFSQYKGKKLLLVNTASKCGYTPQYEDLEKLHKEYGAQITILGFPCNDFAGQEPGSAAEIKSFCTKNYGVTFTLFEKIHVKGKEKVPLYVWLTDKSQNGWNEQQPTWNFCKYIIDENGNLIAYYPSSVKPFDERILSKIK